MISGSNIGIFTKFGAKRVLALCACWLSLAYLLSPPNLCAAESTPLMLVEELARSGRIELLKKISGQEPGANLDLDALKARASQRLSVRLDFFRPNDSRLADKNYFAFGSEKGRRLPWHQILMVDSLPGRGHENHTAGRFQIRARIGGLAKHIGAGEAPLESFPVRIYRMFMNEIADSESVYVNALKQMFGSEAITPTGQVREPQGKRIILHRVKGMNSEELVFVSKILDVAADPFLNPAKAGVPPSFAAFDADAFYAQAHQKCGDEEPDGWGFAEAMKKQGYVSAGLAHPYPRTFRPARQSSYRFALALEDQELLSLRKREDDFENVRQEAVKQRLRNLPKLLRSKENRWMNKHLAASKVTGRPYCNGAFLVSTGVQKLVVTARRRAETKDTSWRQAGIVHAVDGHMDQCLVRAPAHTFLFSGHGYEADFGNYRVPIINTYAKSNAAIYRENNKYQVVATPYLPRYGGWGHLASLASPENRINLSGKWLKSEVNLQWLILVGCQALRRGHSPFRRWSSSSGNMGDLVIHRLGAKGVLGFSEHGFTSLSFMKRFVEKASRKGVAKAWIEVWRDKEARSYSWYETNEQFGRSDRYTYSNSLRKKVPAYLVRRECLEERLVPEKAKDIAEKPIVEFLEVGAYDSNRRSGSY